jgi:phenylacetate-CoA ligase
LKIFQTFVNKISSPVIARKEGLPNLFQHLKELRYSENWNRDRILELQFVRLKKLLQHAYGNTIFYRKRFDAVDFDPNKLKYPEEIRQIPILTKEDIRESLDSMLANCYKAEQLHTSETGGTTGVKMRFYRDNACLSLKEGALYRFENWAGWNFGERVGVIWPATADYVGYWSLKAKLKNELFGRQVVLPAAMLDEKIIGDYVALLIKKQPAIIRGFSSPVFEVANYIYERNMEVPVKGVITTGEPLFLHQRQIIEKAFQCRAYDSYRTREVGPVAQQCSELRGLHINAECLNVEVEPLPGSEDGTGEIIITDLVNYGMPLIRYSIGDLGKMSSKTCPCGRGLPIIENICGRTADVFLAPNGKRIMAITLVLYLVDEAPGLLGQVQIIQDALNHIIIRMTPDPMPTQKIKDFQIKKVKELFGPEMKVSFEIVDSIPRGPSGKYPFTICQINKNQETPQNK